MNKYSIFIILFSTLSASDNYRRKDTPRELAAGRTELPAPKDTQVISSAMPIAIFQRCENHIECVTQSGDKIRFRVKLTVNVKPMLNEAEVKMDIFQGTRLITSRNLDFFW